MKQIFITILLVFGFSQSTFTQVYTGDFSLKFQNNDVESSMEFYVPTDYDSTKSYKLFYGWHGQGMPAINMKNIIKGSFSTMNNMIVVCPDVNNIIEKSGDYLSNVITQSLGYVHSQYNIDTTDRVITGFSMGGSYAYQIGLGTGDFFKGIIGLSPAIGNLSQDNWANITNVNMATILGDQDFNYSVVDGLMKQIQNQDCNLLYLIKPGVEHSDQNYFGSQEFIDDYNQCYDFVVGSTSVNESTDDFTNLYPNPAKYELNIAKLENKVIKSIEIFNLNGEKVFSDKDYTNSNINISEFGTGTYVVKLRSIEGVDIQKIIIE